MNRLKLMDIAPVWLLLASFTLLGWSPVRASLVLEVVRIDDNTAQISGIGALAVDIANYYISLDGATTQGNMGFDVFSGTLSIGGITPNAVYTRNATNDFWLEFFDPPFPIAGDAIAGIMTASLDVETWAPLGTTGTISDGSNTLGSYTIVSSFSTVPVPAGAWLFGSGLLGLSGIARRRKA